MVHSALFNIFGHCKCKYAELWIDFTLCVFSERLNDAGLHVGHPFADVE